MNIINNLIIIIIYDLFLIYIVDRLFNQIVSTYVLWGRRSCGQGPFEAEVYSGK